MDIYILRHERRGSDNSYNSCLSKKGLSNAISLVKTLENLNIKTIFCSPFIRAIQTVHPYSIKFNVPINIDNSIIEYISEPKMLDNYKHTIFTDKEKEYWNINKNYISSCPIENLSMGKNNEYETIQNIKKRTLVFKNHLYNNSKTEGNILVVSHKTTLDYLWRHFFSTKRELEMGEFDLLCNLKI